MYRVPFNWVGNKLKYTYFLNSFLVNKKYDRVIDLFMGSGNLLLNLECKTNSYIGNDLLKLMPNIYNYIKNNDIVFEKKGLQDVINRWEFIKKDDYYRFRDYWNERYISDDIDISFICETVLLLKLCKNSIVRFNKKGEFNQGFRGFSVQGKGCFNGVDLNVYIKELNNIKRKFNKNDFYFYNKDFRLLIEELSPLNKNDLLLADPPYLLSNKEVYGGDFDDKDDYDLLNILCNCGCDFLLFNYLENGGYKHNALIDFVEKNNLRVISLSNNCTLNSGCNLNKKLNEVLVTNI